MQEGI